MVDRIEFSPLGGVDPRQLFAQRDARAALASSLATAAPQVTAPGPRPAPEAPQPAERAEPEPEEEERPQREENAQQAAPGAPRVEQNTAPALGGARETGGGPDQAPEPADAALEARLGGDAFQISVPGTELARAQGAPLFGGLGPAGPENPLARDIAPLGEGGRGEQSLPGPRPLGGGSTGDPAALGPQGPGRAEPAPAPPAPGTQPEQNEPRGSVVDVLV
ncbi:MAG: hypothetical protein A3J27_11360 [Candidatus Tectomicrobia bacterium RIFCSPLOWO2_12_FULL_69_37]|nr:MAG: hypothetical protein A3I72_08805 [Candidatus Tectomicrobia bacterium RIFCSPLOWO2_02_FULL_70_19]OGL66812.1 MAG: hypothetical protein A3J27_11360 [Candidatus Tectomicrobia bacterium RIFCSPLOWO2_12_FULL_69_37]